MTLADEGYMPVLHFGTSQLHPDLVRGKEYEFKRAGDEASSIFRLVDCGPYFNLGGLYFRETDAGDRPQALPEDVRGLVDTWNHIADNIRPIKPDTLRAAISFITAQQATIQEMAGESILQKAQISTLRADLDEAVGVAEKVQQLLTPPGNTWECNEPEWQMQAYRSICQFLAKHQPKDPADDR